MLMLAALPHNAGYRTTEFLPPTALAAQCIWGEEEQPKWDMELAEQAAGSQSPLAQLA